jgi:hypothetical protein
VSVHAAGFAGQSRDELRADGTGDNHSALRMPRRAETTRAWLSRRHSVFLGGSTGGLPRLLPSRVPMAARAARPPARPTPYYAGRFWGGVSCQCPVSKGIGCCDSQIVGEVSVSLAAAYTGGRTRTRTLDPLIKSK